MTRDVLPLLRDLKPLEAVVRCIVCDRLVLARELCIDQGEADWCQSPDRVTEFVPVESVV